MEVVKQNQNQNPNRVAVINTGNNIILSYVVADVFEGMATVGEEMARHHDYFVHSLRFDPVKAPTSLTLPQGTVLICIMVILEKRLFPAN